MTKKVYRKKQNPDYVKKKTTKHCLTFDIIGYQDAIVTGNMMIVMARVQIGWDVVKSVSVYAKGKSLYKGNYVSHYAIRWTKSADEYKRSYDDKPYKPTALQLREKDDL